jgi:hypothetical protein
VDASSTCASGRPRQRTLCAVRARPPRGHARSRTAAGQRSIGRNLNSPHGLRARGHSRCPRDSLSNLRPWPLISGINGVSTRSRARDTGPSERTGAPREKLDRYNHANCTGVPGSRIRSAGRACSAVWCDSKHFFLIQEFWPATTRQGGGGSRTVCRAVSSVRVAPRRPSPFSVLFHDSPS